MGTVERRILGTVSLVGVLTRTAAPEHVSSVNCRRPAGEFLTRDPSSRRPLTARPECSKAAVYSARAAFVPHAPLSRSRRVGMRIQR